MELRAYLDENFRFTERYLKEHLPEAGFRISESTYLACPRAALEEGLCRICEAANTKHTEKYIGEQQQRSWNTMAAGAAGTIRLRQPLCVQADPLCAGEIKASGFPWRSCPPFFRQYQF